MNDQELLTIDREIAEQIVNMPEVHDVLQGFSYDSTEDNAIIVVQEVIKAFKEKLKCEK